MNPEEGELRSQFLDRFGLCVAVDTVTGLESREKIVRNQFAFERDPEGFLREWEHADRVLLEQVARARKALDDILIPDGLITSTVRLTRGLELQGHRADIMILKAARAHAALMEKMEADVTDVAQGARLALPHRLKSSPLESLENLREKIDHALAGEFTKCEEKQSSLDAVIREESLDEMAESMQVPGSMAAGSILFSFLGKKQKETVFCPDDGIGAAAIDVEDLLNEGGRGQRLSGTRVLGATGRYVRAQAVTPGERGYRIALDATLRQAALNRSCELTPPGDFAGVRQQDLRKKQFERPCENLIVFVVDASESMGSGIQVRMKAAKGAALAILRKAYQSRSEVALVAFGGEKAGIVLPPTSSVEVARPALERLPAGGATPFADGLWQGWQIVRSARIKTPSVRPILVIISDGEANVPLVPGAEPFEELGALAEKIAQDHVAALFIDAAVENPARSEMRRIADRMCASYVSIRDLTARCILDAVYKKADWITA